MVKEEFKVRHVVEVRGHTEGSVLCNLRFFRIACKSTSPKYFP